MAKKQMLINTVQDQECRIAILDGNQLEELYIERASSASQVGNIYKGRVTNVEPSIQAAFIDFGGVKNGFLHISDVHPQYFPGGKKKNATEAVGNKRPRRDRPPIQECLRRGNEVVVQMTKEGIGTKGPTLSTYLSIPGRLLVMMPGMKRLGVSRKVEDLDARSKARNALGELKLPDNMGFIVRTAGVGHTKRALQRDLNYLMRLWKSVKQRIKKTKAPVEIYQESNLVIRTIRDVYNSDISRIICDDHEVARAVREFLSMAVPRTKHTIEVYTGKEGLFYEFGVEEEIEEVYSRRVEMNSGGSLVLDQTEALVAIDVNSGRFKAHSNAETTALKINEEAAREILRQLRLRDLGGVIVIDFIDMRSDKNRRQVEKIVREGLKADRAKTKMLRMSSFGLMELTRQRVRPSLKHSIFRQCADCEGIGLIKSEESLALTVLRDLQRATADNDITRVEVTVRPDVAYHLSNHQRHQIARLEKGTQTRIIVQADDTVHGDEVQFVCKNSRGSVISWDREGKRSGKRGNPPTQNLQQYEKNLPQQQRDQAQDPVPGDSDVSEKQQDSDEDSDSRKKRRRGRRGGKKHRKDDKDTGQKDDGRKDQAHGREKDKQQDDEEKSKRRRRRRKPRKSDSQDQQEQKEQTPEQKPEQDEKQDQQDDKSKRSRRRRRPRKPKDSQQQDKGPQKQDDPAQAEKMDDGDKRRRRRRSKSPAKDSGKSESSDTAAREDDSRQASNGQQDDSKRRSRRRPRRSARKEQSRDGSKDESDKAGENDGSQDQRRCGEDSQQSGDQSSRQEPRAEKPAAQPAQAEKEADRLDASGKTMPKRVKRSARKKASQAAAGQDDTSAAKTSKKASGKTAKKSANKAGKKATRKTAKKSAKKSSKKSSKKAAKKSTKKTTKKSTKKSAKKRTRKKTAKKSESDSPDNGD